MGRGPHVTPLPSQAARAGEAVWTYWEDVPGSTRSAYLDLCLETIQRHADGLEVHVLGRDDAERWIPDIDRGRWERLPAPNYRSDYIRSRLLQRYGGVWIDVDTVALSPLTQLLDEIDESGMVCWGKELERFFGGLCAATAGSSFAAAWAAGQDETLSKTGDWSQLHYAALAQDVTWGLARELPWKALPLDKVCPIPWYEWRRFFSRVESPRRVLAASPVAVVLWNAVMGPPLAGYGADRLLESRMLLGRLLRLGLGHSDLEREEDSWTRLHGLSDVRFSTFGQRVELTARRALSTRRSPDADE